MMVKIRRCQMSVHIIADLLGVRAELIEKAEVVKSLLEPVVKEVKFNILGSRYHQFKPYGVSCIYLLAESHISLHTWPEAGYVAMDIFTCGDEEKAFRAMELIEKAFEPKDVRKQVIWRNYYKKLPVQRV